MKYRANYTQYLSKFGCENEKNEIDDTLQFFSEEENKNKHHEPPPKTKQNNKMLFFATTNTTKNDDDDRWGASFLNKKKQTKIEKITTANRMKGKSTNKRKKNFIFSSISLIKFTYTSQTHTHRNRHSFTHPRIFIRLGIINIIWIMENYT